MIKKNFKFKILIVGNWSLTNNFASLFDFLNRISTKTKISIYLVGQISYSKKKLLKKNFF